MCGLHLSCTFCFSTDHYLAHIAWQNDSVLLATWVNRLQNKSISMLCDATTGKCQVVSIMTVSRERHVSNHQYLNFLFNRFFFRLTIHIRAPHSWWRHQMETFSALLALCAGNSPSLVNSPHKGQWRRALMFSLICAWINNGEAGDLRHIEHSMTSLY